MICSATAMQMECMHLDWAPWVAAGCCGLLVVAIAALMRYLYQRAARAEACIAALQADGMATLAELRAEHSLNPRALVQTLLDMLQNGEVPPDQDLDLLRGLLIESHEVDLPLSLEEMLRENSIEPAVEDSILCTLGQRRLFPVTDCAPGNIFDQGAQDVSVDREAEAASYERILSSLAQERSVFDSSGSRTKRTCLLFKRHAQLNKSCSSSSNCLHSDALNMQSGRPSVDVAVDNDTTKSEGMLSTSQAALRRRRSVTFDSAFCGTQGNEPLKSSSMGDILGRIWTGRSASLTNSRSHSRRSSLDGEDEAAPGTALRTAMRLSLGLSSSRRSSLAGGDVVVSRMDGELRKSSPDGFPGLRRPRALFKSASSLSQGARRGEEQEQQPQQDWGQQLQQQHDPEAEADEGLGPSCSMPQPPLADEVNRLLAQADTSFFFDTFALDEATSGHALSVLGFYLLNRTGMTSNFKISLARLAQFLRKIEAGMKAVPYHNAAHVADVLQTLHAMCSLGGLSAAIADPLYMLSAYLAAIIHDYEHQGLTNAFLIATESPLALRYNDTAPLEQHHLSSAFALMKEHDLLPILPKPEFLRLRKVVIDLVLATDMAKHLDIMGRISALAASASAGRVSSKPSFRPSYSTPVNSPFSRVAAQPLRSWRSTNCTISPTSSLSLKEPLDGSDSNSNNGSQLALDESKKVLLLQVALKCADLGHMAESFDVHSRWVSRLEEELFQQGDQEKAIGLPVSPLCDRSNPGITKSQEGFINFVVSPLFHAYTTVMPDARPMVNAIEANSRLWAERNT
mmetsp:Transcript_27681/g.71306  ORF Transcript_27681/g.71306 Transcript_27681/m.71306 type:complete len:798 (+) Transcript_27681:266-2659(+)